MVNTIPKNEVLKDKELDRVTGGNRFETLCDSKFLYDYGLVSDWHGEFHMTFNWISDSAEIDDGWKKAGITSVTTFVGYNEYFLGGKKLSRGEAYDIVREKFKRIHHEYYGHTCG